MIDNCPSFRSILSSTKVLSYDIAKHLVPVLEPITTNKFTIKNSFKFAEEVNKQDSGLFMSILDMGFLFSNIPLQKNINISCDSPLGNKTKINTSSRKDF